MIIALDIILWRLNGGDVLESFLTQRKSQEIKSLFLIFRFLTLIFWIRKYLVLIHDSVAKHDFGRVVKSKKNPILIPIQRNF